MFSMFSFIEDTGTFHFIRQIVPTCIKPDRPLTNKSLRFARFSEACVRIVRGVDFKLTPEMAYLRNRPHRANDAYRPGNDIVGTVGVRPAASLA
jgi:hypothetical protein